jgi:hypothetical protein
MSFSSQILSFLGVSAVYIGFTFVWAWYKGRQDDGEATAAAAEERAGTEDSHGRTADAGTDTPVTMDTDTDDDGTAENGGEH